MGLISCVAHQTRKLALSSKPSNLCNLPLLSPRSTVNVQNTPATSRQDHGAAYLMMTHMHEVLIEHRYVHIDAVRDIHAQLNMWLDSDYTEPGRTRAGSLPSLSLVHQDEFLTARSCKREYYLYF